jgi:O-methyltransferase involved in polyketide biosynthesis
MGDLSVTALYTSATWSWGGLPDAELLEHPDARRVFRAVNGALTVARPFLGASDAPLPVALLHRHTFIDALLHSTRPARVLELAAGLSRRGVTLSGKWDVDYVEVDQAPVIATKRALLGRSAEGRAALARTNLRMVGADVLATSLDVLAPRDGRALTVVAEGLMMYLDADAQRALAKAVAARLADGGGVFVFDLVPPREQPPPTAVGRGLGWLMKRFTGGRGFAPDERTREDVRADLHACGFAQVDATEPRCVAHAWGLPHPDAPTRQLVFVAGV